LIDTNGNGFSVNDPQDLVIQAIRPVAFCPPIPPATANVDCVKGSVDEIAQARNQGFIMVVRVYRADAFANGALPDEAPTGTDQSNVFIGTLGSRNNPLVSSISEIFPEADSESIKGRNNLLIGGT
jgi:hypothetical protein